MRYICNKGLNRDDRGVASIEFAIIAPVMALLLAGLFDISNFVYCNNKMIATAQEISNIVTRGNLTKPQLDTLLQASVYTAQPFNFTANGNVIVTAVTQPSSANTLPPPTVAWRDSWPGGTGGSRISPGALPGGLSLATNQTVIFTEVFYTYTPMFPGYNLITSGEGKIYSLAAGVPRQGNMTTLPAS